MAEPNSRPNSQFKILLRPAFSQNEAAEGEKFFRHGLTQIDAVFYYSTTETVLLGVLSPAVLTAFIRYSRQGPLG
jgi:hypothetical protein